MAKSAYVGARLTDESRIENIRDSMINGSDGHGFYRKVKPHITIVPPFRIPEESVEDAKRIVDSIDIRDKSVEVLGTGVWKNIHKPYVVLLDIGVNYEKERNELVNGLDSVGAINFKEPVNPHITLFKTKGFWKDIPEDIKYPLQEQICKNRHIPDTEISEVKLIMS